MKISREQLWKEIGFEPHAGQADIIASDTRFKVACCGIRFGKSEMNGHMLTHAMFKPNSRYWIVGPTYALGEKEFRVVHSDIVEKLGLGSKCRVSYNIDAGNMSITMNSWNARLEVKSAERPKGLKGESLDGAVMAEAAELPRTIWDGYIRGRLTDRKGWATFFSTPKGFNYFYDFWVRGQNPNFENWESWAAPSWVNNFVFPGGEFDDEVTDMKKSMTDTVFAQEVRGEFTTFEGKIYAGFNEAIHVRPLRYNPDWPNYEAFDFGFSNPFVCLDIQVSPNEDVYVWREYYVRRRDVNEHVAALKQREQPEGFRVMGYCGDPAAAGDIAVMSKQLGAISARRAEWIVGVNIIINLLKQNPDGRPRLFIDTGCRNLIREMHGLRLDANRSQEKNTKEGQYKHDDHACDALRYFTTEFFEFGMGVHMPNDLASSNATFFPDGRPSITTGLNL